MAEPKTVTLTAPNGMQVSVAAKKRDRLLASGYKPVEAAPAKKSPTKRSSAKSD